MQFNTLKRLTALVIGMLLVSSAFAQTPPRAGCKKDGDGKWKDAVTSQLCINTITTAVGFMTIDPSARNAAMGDVGVALSPTANSVAFNASALAFSEESGEIQASYTPWLQALNLEDVYVAYLSGYGKLDDLQTLYGSIRYFSYGNINYTDEQGAQISSGRPYEFALDAGYARKLTDNWSASVTGRYILSSLANGLIVPGSGGDEIGNAQTGAADIGVTYQQELAMGNGALLRAGLAVTNLGAKITYTNSVNKDFLPANMALGSSLEYNFDEFNSFTVALDFNKLLVPTPQFETKDEDGNGRPDYLDKSPIEAAFSSFNDAPNGLSGELSEINTSIGFEYWYAKQFAARAGYFHESDNKGGRQYLTVGVGIRYNVLGLDFSYLVPTSSVRTPLDNTLRLTLGYIFQSESLENI